jgi:hypothetical protein
MAAQFREETEDLKEWKQLATQILLDKEQFDGRINAIPSAIDEVIRKRKDR